MLTINKIRKFKKIFFLLKTAAVAVLAIFLINWHVDSKAGSYIASIDNVQKSQIFGRADPDNGGQQEKLGLIAVFLTLLAQNDIFKRRSLMFYI